jgi:BirA family transcriptional regulator, biotin operon repressor / biotin---[acetyl-CoA-carboxylase] ligase
MRRSVRLVTSRWTDLERPPLSPGSLLTVVEAGGVWRDVRVVASTGSTNADVARAAGEGAAEGLVVVAEEQTSGRGRLDRVWVAPPRSSVLLSVLLRPATPIESLPLLPLLAGLAVVEAVRSVGGVDATLKWPNDVLVGERKLGGILAERVGGGVVVGIGLDVSLRRDELPVPTATSLSIEGGRTDREALTKEVLRALARRYTAWQQDRGAPGAVLPAYREVCATIGRVVRLQLPGGSEVAGVAAAVDDEGRLVLRGDGTTTTWSAGEVVHVRPGE